LEAELVFGDAVDEVDLVVEREGSPDQTKSILPSNQARIIHQQERTRRKGRGSRCVPERREVPEPGGAGVGDRPAPQRLHQRRQRLLPPRRRHLPYSSSPSAGGAASCSRGIGSFAPSTSENLSNYEWVL
jgi:hypothetical protein